MKTLLSVLAGFLLASASFAEVPEGVAYTTEVVVNAAQITSGSTRRNHNETTLEAHVSLDVRGLTAKRGWAAGTYDATLYCPAAVNAASGESMSRSGVALATGTLFKVSLPAHNRKGHDAETWRCWIRLEVSASVDAEDAATPQVDELLPVDITYEWRHRA